MYRIIVCNKCGTPQYVRKDQKNRKCPRCGYTIQCQKMKTLSVAETEMEASQIVRNMKTPGEIGQRVAKLKAKLSKVTTKYDNFQMLSNLLTELLAIFPNAMPRDVLIEKAKEVGLEDIDFIHENLEKMSQEGLVIMNIDFNKKIILKFPSVPFTLGKITVSKPKSSVEFFRDKWEKFD